MRVSVSVARLNPHASLTCKAIAKGISRCGDHVDVRPDINHKVDDYDAVVLWGYTEPCQKIIENCKRIGIPWLFMDMGYWRREKNYFKVAVNDRHPTRYLMSYSMPDDRLRKLKVSVKPWKPNPDGIILVAGMSHKASWSWGFDYEEYERNTIKKISELYPDIPIVYRPKPNWSGSKVIPNSRFDRRTPLHKMWPIVRCVVSHHSNVCCDALIEGIPAFAKYGAASVFKEYDLTKILDDAEPPQRYQWAANLAYAQWNIEEMRSGLCWDFFKQMDFYRDWL